MSGKLRTRLSVGRVFLLSGFDDKERKDLAKKINQLGGIYFDTESFKSSCTHVVCGKLSRSEKFLGACATGKWVLHPSYIHQSSEKGEWLNEENYEWNTVVKEQGSNMMMAEAPRRWRFYGEAFQKSAFKGWRVAVVVTGTKKNTVYKRLLTSGGAEVYNLKLPVTKPEKVVGTLAYIFVNDKSAGHVYHLMEYGVLCLKPEFIGDYLIKDPLPDPFDYLISPPGSVSPGHMSQHDASLELSQYSVDSTQERDSSTSFTPKGTPALQGTVSSSQSTPTGTPSSTPGKLHTSLFTPVGTPSSTQYTLNSSLITPRGTPSPSLGRTCHQSTPEVDPKLTGRITPTVCLKQLSSSPVTSELSNSTQNAGSSRQLRSKRTILLPSAAGSLNDISKIDVNSSESTSDKGESSTKGDNLVDPSQTESVPNQAVKRKLTEDDYIEDALKEIKKQRISLDRFVWRPTVLTLNGNLQTGCLENTDTPVVLTSSMTFVLHTCLEEEGPSTETLLSALDQIMSIVTTRKYLQSATVHLIMTKILQEASSPLLAQRAHIVLMRILYVHPPVKSAVINMYMESFLGQVQNDLPDADPTDNQKWDFLKNVIKGAVMETENSDMQNKQRQNNSILLLKYLIAVLEQNFQFSVTRFKSGECNVHKLRSSMLAKLLWPSMNQVCLSGRCRELLSLFEDCLACLMDKERKIEVVRLISSLICMAVELCGCMESGIQRTSTLNMLQGNKVSAFINHIAQKINACKLDCVMLRQVLGMIQPSWICLGICCSLLNELDDYLIMDGLHNGSLSLSSIVSKYFFLLPKLSHRPDNLAVCLSPHKKCNRPQKQNEIDNSHPETLVTKQEDKRMIRTIKKRNAKGETPLHTACIKNNVIQLKQLLKVPGVDINVKDNAGWTPLHEACNHGSIQCVTELLHFVPARTVDQYFTKESDKKCRKADLLASTELGITPLHDAVMNERLEVCQLLLQHGGSALLQSKTEYGYMPIDLANTDTMRSLLQSYELDNGLRMSSQESQSSQEGLYPSEIRYQQVLGLGDAQQYTDREECSKYIHITTQLVKSYIETTNIRTIQRALKSTQVTRVGEGDLSKNLNFISDSGVYENNENVKPPCNAEIVTNDKKLKSVNGVSVSSEEVQIISVSLPNHGQQVTLLDGQRDHIRKDLKFIKKWPKYIKKFENHLLKISEPEDHDVIQSELLFLHSMSG